MTTVANIQRAADHIDATELSDGVWAHRDDGMGRWYVVTAAELAKLCEYLDSDDESVANDAYSHWCAGTSATEMPEGWEPGKSVYTYTIFDANPNSSSGTAWPSHDSLEIVADDDDGAIEAVRDVMSVEAAGLNPDDGYDVGQRLYAIVWGADTVIVGEPTYTLTAEDLGVDGSEQSASEEA